MEYAVFKQQIMEQAKRILPQEEGYVITIVDQTEYGLGEMLIINKSDKEVVPGMEGERNMPSGLKGKVCYVDDAGQIHVNWENGSSLAVLPEVDSFHKIGEPHKRKEHDMQR